MQAKEREIKLVVEDDFELPGLISASTGVAAVMEEPPLDLGAVYFDTPDLELMSHGITVRRREGEASTPVWTLKLPIDGDLTLRSEVTVASSDWEPPDEINSLLRTVLGATAVQRIVELRTQRLRSLLMNDNGDVLAELCDDRVTVVNGSETTETFREIEVEAREADVRQLKKIGRRIEKSGGRREQTSKAYKALSATDDIKSRPIAPAVRPGDPVSSPVSSAVSAAIAAHTHAMVAHAPNAFLGEAEGVHRMRVRQRALRSVLRSFAPVVDEAKLAPPNGDLRWLGEVLGEVRDLDVLAAGLRSRVQADGDYAPLLQWIDSRVASARESLRQALASDRYEGLIRTLRALASDDSFVTSTGTCREELPKLAVSAADRLSKAGRDLTAESPESDYHEVRKLAKRARYTAEMVANYVGKKQESSLLRFATRVTAVQRTFGDHQDSTVARDRLVAIAQKDFATDGPMSLRIGRLVEQADQDASRLRRMCLRAWDGLVKELPGKWPKA